MAKWLLKTEPTSYSIDDLRRDKRTEWTGVRNYQARNNLRLMAVGDLAFVYHSGDVKAVVGLAKVVGSPRTDSTCDDDTWVSVDVAYVSPVKTAATLADVKGSPKLRDLALVKNGRLSVMPVSDEEWLTLEQLTGSAR